MKNKGYYSNSAQKSLLRLPEILKPFQQAAPVKELNQQLQLFSAAKP